MKTDSNVDGWVPVDPFGGYFVDEIDVLALRARSHGRAAQAVLVVGQGVRNLFVLHK